MITCTRRAQQMDQRCRQRDVKKRGDKSSLLENMQKPFSLKLPGMPFQQVVVYPTELIA